MIELSQRGQFSENGFRKTSNIKHWRLMRGRGRGWRIFQVWYFCIFSVVVGLGIERSKGRGGEVFRAVIPLVLPVIDRSKTCPDRAIVELRRRSAMSRLERVVGNVGICRKSLTRANVKW